MHNPFKDTPGRFKFQDYSAPGLYFITICFRDRDHLFGEIEKGKMIYPPAGQLVSEEFKNQENYHDRVSVDEFVQHPNMDLIPYNETENEFILPDDNANDNQFVDKDFFHLMKANLLLIPITMIETHQCISVN